MCLKATSPEVRLPNNISAWVSCVGYLDNDPISFISSTSGLELLMLAWNRSSSFQSTLSLELLAAADAMWDPNQWDGGQLTCKLGLWKYFKNIQDSIVERDSKMDGEKERSAKNLFSSLPSRCFILSKVMVLTSLWQHELNKEAPLIPTKCWM